MVVLRPTIRFLLLLFATLLLAGIVVHGQEETVDCSAMLVTSVSGASETCEGFSTSENAHYWPIGNVEGCHGWRGTDPDGKVHDNSATNIRCSEDGTQLLYTQYAASLDCSSTDQTPVGEEKSFILNECHQGIPTTLYDMATNLDCCTDPEGDSCKNMYTGLPRVDSVATSDEVIYWNGKRCADDDDAAAAGGDDSGGDESSETTTTGEGGGSTSGVMTLISNGVMVVSSCVIGAAILLLA